MTTQALLRPGKLCDDSRMVRLSLADCDKEKECACVFVCVWSDQSWAAESHCTAACAASGSVCRRRRPEMRASEGRASECGGDQRVSQMRDGRAGVSLPPERAICRQRAERCISGWMTIPAMLLLVVPPAVVVERGSVNGRRGTGSALRLELDRLVGQRRPAAARRA
jgi:hypothetical protein